jgi:hypothetical protein
MVDGVGMPRGFVWAVYRDDDGTPWAVQADRDYVAQASRGWSTDGVDLLPPLPRRWRPRRVVGFDDSGRTQVAIVASVEADLWTGTATTFDVEASDQSTVTATVLKSQGERRVPVTLPPD